MRWIWVIIDRYIHAIYTEINKTWQIKYDLYNNVKCDKKQEVGFYGKSIF